MDLHKCLKKVKTLNEYESFTWDLENKRISLRVPFNISTIAALKDIRSIEIEYYKKYKENGASIKIFERLLESPPSKTWSLLAADLVSLLHYWLEVIRKHIVIHNIHWWTFLKRILTFIKDIHSKDASINRMLIEDTAECLLDLATHSGNTPDAMQRYEIVQIFNIVCAESTRNIRLAYKDKFEKFFTKLSSSVAVCGDFLLQYRSLETLLRWLLPRHEPAVRRATAAAWFPEGLYTRSAVNVFLESSWHNFMKDARDFLNAQNECGDLVISNICKKLSIGERVCLSGTEKTEVWLDVNSSTRCLSMLLEPALSEALGGARDACDVMRISDENTAAVQLTGGVSRQPLLAVTVLVLSRVYPFSSAFIEDCSTSSTINISVSSRSDVSRLDRGLRAIFGDKYQTTLDVENFAVHMSPCVKLSNSDIIDGTGENVRISMPSGLRRRHTGDLVKPRKAVSLRYPSSVSTSSLAQLHEKLAAFPRNTYEKKKSDKVSALPQLSTVSELTENEKNITRNSSLSTTKLRTCGVLQKKSNKAINKTSTDIDIRNGNNDPAPVGNDSENSVSCLLVATIGSANDSIISDTIERLPKNNLSHTDNIVELLAREAFQENIKRGRGISAGVNKNTANAQSTNHYQSEKPDCGNEKQAVDESSNEIVENTPLNWVQVKTSKPKTDKYISEVNSVVRGEKTNFININHDVEAVENFFSQHFNENRNGDLIISPSLARKINETSSECSESIEARYILQDFEIDQLFTPDVHIVECVNTLVDKVCQYLDKCKYMDSMEGLKEVDINTKAKINAQENTPKQKRKPSKAVKLQFKNKKTITCKKQPFKIMSPIVERESVTDDTIAKNFGNQVDLPMLRRKRKLYSPKDETRHEKTNVHIIDATEDDTTTNSELKTYSETSKSMATCYKELEKERKKQNRRPRTRSSKKEQPSASPRTLKKNQIFDSLKTVEDGETVKLVDKTLLRNDVYNFTSDSDDEDVEKKEPTNAALIKVSSPIGNRKTVRRAHKQAAMKIIQPADEKKTKDVKRTRNLRTKRKITECQKESVPKIPKFRPNIEDERMRENASEILNTSLVIECSRDPEKSLEKPSDPVLNVVPHMEWMDDGDQNAKEKQQNIKERQLKSKRMLSLKRNKKTPKAGVDISLADNEGTVSPLPGLVVETVLTTKFDINDSVSTNMLEKYKDIYQGKPVTDSEVNITQNLLSDTNENEQAEVIQLSVTEVDSKRSIATIGKSHSPTTGRGDFDEDPPNLTVQKNQPRVVEQEYSSQSRKRFHSKLTDQLNEPDEDDCMASDGGMNEDNKSTDDRSSNNTNRISPVVLLTRMSPEYIEHAISGSTNKSKTNLTYESSTKTIRQNKRFTRTSVVVESEKNPKTQDTYFATARRSMISPVKLFDDMDYNNAKTATPSRSGGEDDYLNHSKVVFSNKKFPTMQSNQLTGIGRMATRSKAALKRNIATSSPASNDAAAEQRTERSNSCCRSSEDSCNASKRTASPILASSRRIEFDEVNNNLGSSVTVCESGPSVASVKRWFKRNEHFRTADTVKLCTEEYINNVMEKLDTTLVEIQHNTSERLLDLFAAAESQLAETSQQRQQMQQRITEEILHFIDDKFLALNNRWKSMEDQFMKNLKRGARELISEECRQKCAMVTLLREDIQAMQDDEEPTHGGGGK